MNRLTGKSLTAKEIAKRIEQVQKMQKSGDPKFREYHETVYDDGIWKIDLEVHPYGTYRFWVSREDTYGNYNNSIFSMYRSSTGEIKYSAEYVIKKAVVDRLLKTYIELEKAGIEQ